MISACVEKMAEKIAIFYFKQSTFSTYKEKMRLQIDPSNENPLMRSASLKNPPTSELHPKTRQLQCK